MPCLHRYALILFGLLTIPLRANLGETVAQCVVRYGRPAGFSEANPHFPFGTVAFTAGPYTLVVFLVKDKEVGARVSKLDKSEFTDDERQTILGADSAAGPWVLGVSADPRCLKWNRSDKATVLYDIDKHVVIFTSEEMDKMYHAAMAASAAAPASPAPSETPASPATTNSAPPSPGSP